MTDIAAQKEARAFAEKLLPEKPGMELHWTFSGRAFIQAAYVLVQTNEGLTGRDCERRCKELLVGPLDPVLAAMRKSTVSEVARTAAVLDELTTRERVSILAVAATAAMNKPA